MSGEIGSVGSGGQKDPIDQKKKTNDPDAFKELMKVEKVAGVDPDQKKNRKRREEDVPEDAPVAPNIAPPTSNFADFMQDPSDKGNLFDVGNVEPHFNFNPAPSDGSSESAFFSVGSDISEPQDTTSNSIQNELSEQAPSIPQAPSEELQNTPNPSNLLNPGTLYNPEQNENSSTTVGQSTTNPEGSQQNSTDSNNPTTNKTTPIGSSQVLSEEAAATPFLIKSNLPAQQAAQPLPLQPATEKSLPPSQAKENEKILATPSKAEITTDVGNKADTMNGQKESATKKDDTNPDSDAQIAASLGVTPIVTPDVTTQGMALPGIEPVATPFSSAYANLHPEVLEIFDRMVGYVQVVQDSQAQETTVFVNTKDPASVFNGGRIILTEYATAPNTYNIQFVGNPQAVQLFQQNIPTMMHAFEAGNYRFQVHRLEGIYEEEGKEKQQSSKDDQEKDNQDENP